MPSVADRAEAPTTIRTDLAAIFISLELSRSIWLVTSVSPGSGEKMSKHSVRAGDVAALLARFSELKHKALARTGKSFAIVAIQEAGLDGFWLHRALEQEGIESHVVDPASIATSRRRRRAKTDRIDGEALLRALLAYKRGEPRVCTMVSSDARGRTPPPPLPRAQDAGRRAGRARQSHKRAAVLTGNIELRAAAPRSTPTARGLEDGRRPFSADASQNPDQPRTRSARTAARSNQVGGG